MQTKILWTYHQKEHAREFDDKEKIWLGKAKRKIKSLLPDDLSAWQGRVRSTDFISDYDDQKQIKDVITMTAKGL